MKTPLPFFNWSLTKVLESEPDNFVKARIRIIYAIVLLSLLKIFIVIGLGAANGQWLQVARAAVVLIVYVSIAKVLLYKPSAITLLAHIMIQFGILIVCTNIFVYAHRVNLPTVQFVFMIALSSFYTLGSRWGIRYSVVSILPVMVFLLLKGNPDIYFTNAPEEFASPGFEIIVALNFITILVSHYLFFRATDVSIKEKEKLNSQLQLSIAEANKLATTRSNFLSTISHELRTPLNSVVGITELLLEDSPEERQKENLKILQFSALDLLSLINNVLDFNKIDSDKLVLEKVPVNLEEFMRNVCSGLRIKAADKRLAFILDIDPKLEGVRVISDPTRLSQVIYNLVGNAIKFTEKGSVTVRLGCSSRSDDAVGVLFSVIDTGVGIHPDRHETIFEMFTQAESHITRKYGGTGLGLAIVKQVLALFGSEIRLESQPGKGSRFFFGISCEVAARIEATYVPPELSTIDISHVRVLIAEDNDINRTLIRKQFERLKLQPVIVENGEQAYSACVDSDFDVVFLDLHMPVQDGYETVRQIRGMANPAKAGMNVIAFTASVNEQQKIFDNGFNDFLHKPVNMNDLREKLEKAAQYGQVSAI